MADEKTKDGTLLEAGKTYMIVVRLGDSCGCWRDGQEPCDYGLEFRVEEKKS